ncbi:hypothetical protein J6590_047749 [Homalodisca vitripennis]|nr:hypothetical protein J6590_047749 [Homalodisca vitripennis]
MHDRLYACVSVRVCPSTRRPYCQRETERRFVEGTVATVTASAALLQLQFWHQLAGEPQKSFPSHIRLLWIPPELKWIETESKKSSPKLIPTTSLARTVTWERLTLYSYCSPVLVLRRRPTGIVLSAVPLSCGFVLIQVALKEEYLLLNQRPP